MAPQKKGRNSKDENKSAVTLHRFFTSPGVGPSKGSSVRKSLKKSASSGTRFDKTNEIIVIDSDSDVEVEFPPARPLLPPQKKRRLSATRNSSDVERLESTSAPVKRVASDNARASLSVSVGRTLVFGKPSALLMSPSDPPKGVVPSLSFGFPSALLVGSNSSEGAPCTPALNSRTPSGPVVPDLARPPLLPFGAPLALLGAPGTALTFGKPTSLLLGEPSLGNGCPSPSVMERDGGMDEDEWGMGDDEKVVSIGDDDDEATLIDEPVDMACPICRKSVDNLSEAERQAHVNRCLDGDSAPEPPSKTPLKPLSSFPVPNAGRTPKENGGNAFSVLMTSCTEVAVWNEAATAEASRATKTNRRPAPFYKVMQGMPIAVDAFRYGCIPGVTAYFLTHAHSDHYTNLSSSWKHGPIYCSEGTANLIIHMLSVDKKWVHPLPMDVPTLVPNSGGIHVTLIEANHCPGSCLFLFEGPQTVNAGDSAFKSPWVGSSKTFRYLHCGDFRASPQHTQHPAVKGKHLDHVYLDTTYLDPKYIFPPQPLVISACAELAKRIAGGKLLDTSGPKIDKWVSGVSGDPKGKQKAQRERILMVVGTYSVGKERIVKAVAQAVNSKIYCDPRKAAILRCQPDPELHALLTADPAAADVHILPLGSITLDKLQLYLERFKGIFTKVVGFRPTGWTYTPPAGAVQSPSIASVILQTQQKAFTYAHLRPARSPSAELQLFPVPYSEHSSFFELTCFALSLQWGRMIATVNVGSERSRARMTRWMQKWEAEKKKMKKGEVVPHRRSDYW